MYRAAMLSLRAPLRQASGATATATAANAHSTASAAVLPFALAAQRRGWSSTAHHGLGSIAPAKRCGWGRTTSSVAMPSVRTFADKASKGRAGETEGDTHARNKEQPKDSKRAAGDASASAFPSDQGADSSAQPPAASETRSSASRRSTSAFDVDTSELIAAAESQNDGDQATGARSQGAAASRKEAAKRRNNRIFWLVILLTVGGFNAYQLGSDFETIEERQRYANDPRAQSFFGRMRLRISSAYTSFQAPVWEKLLPDPLPMGYQRPYTLVLDVDDLLIHSEWSRSHAWRTAKRPGLDYFLGYLAQFFEIVIYTRQPIHIVGPVIEKLDPDARLIHYSLFRESCRTLDNGHVVKDLGALNRDLSKVIAIDTDPEAVELNPENAIILKPWKGDPKDRDLLGLISFLEAVYIYNIADVRETLKSFAGTHIPTEHARRQAEVKAAEEEQLRKKRSGSGGFGSFFGGIRSGTGSAPDTLKTFYESERERLQQAYVEEQKFWAENGEKLRQQAKEEQEAKLKEMKLNAWGFLTGQAMQPPPSDQQQQQKTA